MSRGEYGGIRGYVRMIASLRDAPSTVQAFRGRLGLSSTGAYPFLGGLHTLGMAHVCDWKLEPRVRPTPVFAFGPGADAPVPEMTLSGRKTTGGNLPKRRAPSTTLIALVMILRAMQDGACSKQDLIDASGLQSSSLRAALRSLIDNNLAHISGWGLDGASVRRPLYSAGPGVAARRPPKQRRQIINAIQWSKRRERLSMAALQRAMGIAA